MDLSLDTLPGIYSIRLSSLPPFIYSFTYFSPTAVSFILPTVLNPKQIQMKDEFLKWSKYIFFNVVRQSLKLGITKAWHLITCMALMWWNLFVRIENMIVLIWTCEMSVISASGSPSSCGIKNLILYVSQKLSKAFCVPGPHLGCNASAANVWTSTSDLEHRWTIV